MAAPLMMCRALVLPQVVVAAHLPLEVMLQTRHLILAVPEVQARLLAFRVHLQPMQVVVAGAEIKTPAVLVAQVVLAAAVQVDQRRDQQMVFLAPLIPAVAVVDLLAPAQARLAPAALA